MKRVILVLGAFLLTAGCNSMKASSGERKNGDGDVEIAGELSDTLGIQKSLHEFLQEVQALHEVLHDLESPLKGDAHKLETIVSEIHGHLHDDPVTIGPRRLIQGLKIIRQRSWNLMKEVMISEVAKDPEFPQFFEGFAFGFGGVKLAFKNWRQTQ